MLQLHQRVVVNTEQSHTPLAGTIVGYLKTADGTPTGLWIVQLDLHGQELPTIGCPFTGTVAAHQAMITAEATPCVLSA